MYTVSKDGAVIVWESSKLLEEIDEVVVKDDEYPMDTEGVNEVNQETEDVDDDKEDDDASVEINTTDDESEFIKFSLLVNSTH